MTSLAHAKELASGFDAELIMVHVLSDVPFFYVPFLGESSAYLSTIDSVKNESSSRLEQLADRARKQGVSARTMLLEGSAYIEIVKFAESEGADLIVMSTTGKKGVEKLLIGSTAQKVVRKAPCPVLTVPTPGRESVSFKNLLVLTDLSGLSALALPYVKDISQEFDSRITALHIMEAEFELDPDEQGLLISAIQSAMEDIIIKDMGKVFDDEVEKVVVKAEDPLSGLQKFASENPVDLVIMTTHGRTGLSRVLMGSVAEKILGSVKLPILTVRARK